MSILEATEYAQEQGQFDNFHHAAYKALWKNGKDLGSMDVIQELAQGCGLNWPELSQRLESGHYRATVQEQFQHAMDLGVHGIPAFMIGNSLFTGAQPYQVFQQVMRKALGQDERDTPCTLSP